MDFLADFDDVDCCCLCSWGYVGHCGVLRGHQLGFDEVVQVVVPFGRWPCCLRGECSVLCSLQLGLDFGLRRLEV